MAFIELIFLFFVLQIEKLQQEDTGKGKLSEEGHFKQARRERQDDPNTIKYEIRLSVGSDFGTPAALSIVNKHTERFFLQHASIEAPNNQIIHFYCNSWIYPIDKTKSDRIFFSNTVSFNTSLFSK